MHFCLVIDLSSELSTCKSIFAVPHPTLNNIKQHTKCRNLLKKRHMFQSFLNKSVKRKLIEVVLQARAGLLENYHICLWHLGLRNHKNKSAPFILKNPVAYLSCSAGRTHFAQTNFRSHRWGS